MSNYRGILLLAILGFVVIMANAQTISTTEGPVKVYNEEGLIKAYNIPYAQSPINELRWKAPQPPLKRTAVWDGKGRNTVCAQVRNQVLFAPEPFGEVTGNEDCLYLDIVAPEDRDKTHPVIVWIHGGSNKYGSKSDEVYDAEVLAKNTRAVIVKVNYRLGILGGLYLPQINDSTTETSAGNYLLLDLIQSLKWIRSNISAFGGDASNITLMGESAGCIDIWGLMLSPLSQGLYHKAICSSGFPLVVSKRKARKQSKAALMELLLKTGQANGEKEARHFLRGKNSQKLQKRLYNLDTKTLVKASESFSPKLVDDGYILKSHGLFAVKKSQTANVPMLTGTTKNEATYFLAGKGVGMSYSELWKAVNEGENIDKVEKFIESEDYSDYWKKAESTTKKLLALVNFHYKRYNRFNPDIYKYQFDVKPYNSSWKELFGSTHASDVIYLFGKEKFRDENFFTFLEPSDLDIFRAQVKEFHSYIKNFIETGNPGNVNGTTWENWNRKPENILHIK
ncbi:carboxylesterase family protein [Allomuricauda taeanensis]|uniref:carboxylesterase family protein n=1 Tax=Flagellimonas taeanensis TaxID=1005926 RepID=UPI002E7C482F|nr:carboxylesterase family protein [Allomuricauda taeanensis]MEE1963926.1 carboxylesterase family protein [Allomuricauda taeanensis]